MSTLGTQQRPFNARRIKWTRRLLWGRIPVQVGTVSAKDLGVDPNTLRVFWVRSPKTGKVIQFESRGPLYKVTGEDQAVLDGVRFGNAGNSIIIEVGIN